MEKPLLVAERIFEVLVNSCIHNLIKQCEYATIIVLTCVGL